MGWEWASLIDKFGGSSKLISFLSKIPSYFSKEKQTIIAPKNQDEFKDIIPIFDNIKNLPQLKDIPDIKVFLDNFEVVRDKERDKYYIIQKKTVDNIIVKKLEENKEVESKQKIDIIPFSNAIKFAEYNQSPKYISKESKDEIEALSPELKSLLGLSNHIKYLYKKGNGHEAQEIKRSIKKRYGEEGLRFCNCYLAGYIEQYILFLKNNGKENINAELWNFSKRPIFFIHQEINLENADYVKNKVKKAIERGENYIAIHGLGTAAKITRKIVEEILDEWESPHHTIGIDNMRKRPDGKKLKSYSFIWYDKDGEHIYNLIRGKNL